VPGPPPGALAASEFVAACPGALARMLEESRDAGLFIPLEDT
jgi:hypothetical protein